MIAKLLTIALIAWGEALAIYSEMIIVKRPGWLWAFGVITVAGVPLLAGYAIGYKAFGSVWACMAVSVARASWTVWAMKSAAVPVRRMRSRRPSALPAM